MLWVVGVVLSLAASVVSNLGFALQATPKPRDPPRITAPAVTIVFGSEFTGSVFTIEEESDDRTDSPAQLVAVGLEADSPEPQALQRQRGPWRARAGLGCMVLGVVLDVVSYGFAPLSLLAPLGCVSLLANLVVAKRVLGESRARADWLACGVIATGTLLAVAFSTKSAALHPLAVVLGNLGSAPFMVYAAVLTTGYRVATWAATRPGAGPVGTAVAWGLASSLAGSAGVGASKVLAEVAVGATPSDLLTPQAGVLAAGATVAMLTQLRMLNRAQAAGGALLAVPLTQVSNLVCNLVAGAVVFSDYSRVRHPSGTVFGVGVAIALAGAGVLVAHGVHSRN